MCISPFFISKFETPKDVAVDFFLLFQPVECRSKLCSVLLFIRSWCAFSNRSNILNNDELPREARKSV